MESRPDLRIPVQTSNRQTSSNQTRRPTGEAGARRTIYCLIGIAPVATSSKRTMNSSIGSQTSTTVGAVDGNPGQYRSANPTRKVAIERDLHLEQGQHSTSDDRNTIGTSVCTQKRDSHSHSGIQAERLLRYVERIWWISSPSQTDVASVRDLNLPLVMVSVCVVCV